MDDLIQGLRRVGFFHLELLQNRHCQFEPIDVSPRFSIRDHKYGQLTGHFRQDVGLTQPLFGGQ